MIGEGGGETVSFFFSSTRYQYGKNEPRRRAILENLRFFFVFPFGNDPMFHPILRLTACLCSSVPGQSTPEQKPAQAAVAFLFVSDFHSSGVLSHGAARHTSTVLFYQIFSKFNPSFPFVLHFSRENSEPQGKTVCACLQGRGACADGLALAFAGSGLQWAPSGNTFFFFFGRGGTDRHKAKESNPAVRPSWDNYGRCSGLPL